MVARVEGGDSSRRHCWSMVTSMWRRPTRSVVLSTRFPVRSRDGFVWGRGAVDIKHMLAMTLAVVREWARTKRKPPRDIVLAFVSDEEAGAPGLFFLVGHHPAALADRAKR